MIEKLDMDKLQKLVYYINNVKMSGVQRERLNCVIISGILRGEIDTADLVIGPASPEASNILQFLDSEVFIEDEALMKKWIQANVLYEKYDCWCGANGLKPESLTIFGRTLKDMGVQRKKQSDGNYYCINTDD